MRIACLALALALAPALGGCITFDDATRITVHLLVTTDVGTAVLRDEEIVLAGGSSALDALDEVASIERAYGGGFVEAIDGLRSRFPDQRVDWFYHVDGRAPSIGASAWTLADGDVVLWDYRPWNRTLALPYVLTGWQRALDGSQLGPAGDASALADLAGDHTMYASVAREQLVVLDAWGVPQRRIAPPWLIVHAHADDHGDLAWLTFASGDGATELVAALPAWQPAGVGVVATPAGLVQVPQ